VLRWRALSLGASRQQWIFRVLLPACHDGIYSALRTSLLIGLIVVAVAEMGGVYERSTGLWWSEGLGYRVFRSYDIARDDFMLGAIITFAVLGIFLEQSFSLLWAGVRSGVFFLRQRAITRTISRLTKAKKTDIAPWPRPAPLELAHIHAGYDGKTVINDLSLTIEAGSTLTVVGPSGCGKTTLLRAIGHFSDEEFRVSGQVVLDGQPVTAPGPRVGIVFQDAPVYDHMTVWDNVAFASTRNGATSFQAVFRLLDEFGLASMATSRARSLSGGQRQRLALASALINRPRLLLLDEPFGALDAITRRNLQVFFWRHVRNKVTAVFVTHDLNEALLVGTHVSVGVRKEQQSFRINPENQSITDWEFTDSFSHLKKRVFETRCADIRTAEDA
jgi:ABC-type nitrate/sulfonate/bicarbonate transport system ATPase subunit